MPIDPNGNPNGDETPNVHLWEALSGNNPVFCDNAPLHPRTFAVAWSSDGRFVAAGDSFGFIEMYDTTTGEVMSKIVPHVYNRKTTTPKLQRLFQTKDTVTAYRQEAVKLVDRMTHFLENLPEHKDDELLSALVINMFAGPISWMFPT